MSKVVLITGVAGLIGSRFADWIIENHPEISVVGIDNLEGGYIENVNEKVDFHKIDLATDDLTEIFSAQKIDLVYHFAAYAAEGLSPYIRRFNYENNLGATANVINNCINYDVKRLVFTSSMAVYGNGNPPFQEDAIPSPIDPYGVAKFACEMDIKIAGEQHGLDWCIIRPHNVYGKKQNIWDKYRNVLGIWMYQYINDLPCTIFGDGNQKRAFSYVDDCLEPLWKAGFDARANKQIINVGGIKEYSINETIEILKDILPGLKVEYLEARHEVKNAYSTHKKSVELLDYEDTISLREGLIEMWEWVKTQPKRDRFEWDQYEIEKGIYKFWKK